MVLAVVTVIVLLFVGLFAINTTGGLITDAEKLDYSYTSVTNSTITNFNSTVNATHKMTIGALSNISGETATKTIVATVENKNATDSFTITTYLNGASLGTFSAANNTNTSNTFTAVAFVASVVNNITYATTATGANPHNIRTSVGTYPSGTANTYVGTNYDDLTTNTNTVYDVMILVVIIFALAVAMGSLKGLQGSAGGTGAM